MDLLHLNSPHGTAWELLIAVVVVLLGPLIMERCRIPGLIGMLVGGMVIGPNVLGVVPHNGGIVKSLGEVGLVYLMFTAGLELDLAVFAQYRRQAMAFAVITFALPLAAGVVAALTIGLGGAAAVLLGSLLASHTLISYPMVKRLGLASNRSVASTVGATVLTDTLALIVLAVISGQKTGGAGGATLIVEVVGGMAVVGGFCFVLLPPLTRYWFASFGRQRTLRYTFALAALLAGAVVAEIVNIEPIVGAFFTGLALNRLVPNEGEFMEHVEFFGSALLIPVFLVSVGTVIDPSVLIDPGTLGLAAAFTAACLGGKLAAAALCHPMFKATWDEVGLVFSLSVAQTAATLAATFVGLDIGLFNKSVVNAVMILILASLLASSLTANFFGRRVPTPPLDVGRLGRSVLVPITLDDPANAAMRLAARLASADGGGVHPLVVVTPGHDIPTQSQLEQAENAVGTLGLESDIAVRHDDSEHAGISHTARSLGSSLVLVTATGTSWLPTANAQSSDLIQNCASPVAFIKPAALAANRVILALSEQQASNPGPAARSAVALAARLRSSGLETVVVATGVIAVEFLTPLSGVAIETTGGTTWLDENARPEDIVVVPAGRNGAAAAKLVAERAEAKGATVIAIADRDTLSVAAAAAGTLGIVTGQARPA